MTNERSLAFMVKFLTERLDEQAATLIEYVEKRHTAAMRDAHSRGFMAMGSMQQILIPRHPLRSLNPYDFDAAIWLDADIAAKRMLVAAYLAARQDLDRAAGTATDLKGRVHGLEQAVRLAAYACNGHSAYDPEWKP